MRSIHGQGEPVVAPPGSQGGWPTTRPCSRRARCVVRRTRPQGATIRGPTRCRRCADNGAGEPSRSRVAYQLLGPLGRGFTARPVTRSISPFDLGGRTVTGDANLRTFERGTWRLTMTVNRSDNSTVNRRAAQRALSRHLHRRPVLRGVTFAQRGRWPVLRLGALAGGTGPLLGRQRELEAIDELLRAPGPD